ncbi:hypothetical protein DUI87_21017 [Hirundo rustica rustica]|uniref:Ubiquitin carboxyl-terminal hydrolase MINDY n=1 Tax=Hirundo rustica rustica TaxID=333673 RepID=A0A3M0JLE4_HIRRU|nr:hypothetical protein DUI87_21017 [Hirundo rustica rustica]
MGDRGAERAVPTELEEITNRISDLSKWREIFSFRGLEINSMTHQVTPFPKRLQELLFGNTSSLFSCEWAAAHFSFHRPHSDLAYALEAGQGGTRAVLAAVQAHIITYLLFTRQTESTHLERLCRVGRREQGQALATVLAETLWAAGGGGRAVVRLVTAPVTTMPREGYRASSFAERIRLFEFSEKAAAQGFISDHINCAVLSLLLTGRASPRGLGGSRDPDTGAGDGDGAARGQRGAVGFLRWERARLERQVSPALRTPRLPVWLCSISGRHSVLFGTDSRLLSDWKSERIFHLYFYSGQQEQTRTAHLTIGTEPGLAGTEVAGSGSPSSHYSWQEKERAKPRHQESTAAVEPPSLEGFKSCALVGFGNVV